MFHEGDVLRKWREERDLTLQQLADQAGLDKNTIMRAERNDTLRTDTQRVIVEALGHTLDELHAALSARDGLTSADRVHLDRWRRLSDESKETIEVSVRHALALEQTARELRAAAQPSMSPTSGFVSDARVPARRNREATGGTRSKKRPRE